MTISAGTTVTATVIKNAVGGATVTGALPLGSSVFDTATVTPTPTGTGFTPTGSVAYTFFTSVDCTTGGTAAGGGALVAGLPPNSNTEGPLAAGSYSFRATFTSGNGNFGTSTSVCEPLTISAGTTVTATVIKNAAGGATVTGALPLGSSVFDTATVTPTPAGFTPMGSVAYTFFGNGTCDGTGSGAGGGALVAGLPPNSNNEGPLAAGSYSFRAIFTSGDSNFGASTSVCEPLTISAGTTVTATVIKNAVGGATVTGALPLGSSVFDTATVTPTPTGTGFTPTGSVAYTFFTSVDCTTGGTAAGGGALVAGLPPNSNTEGPLAAGSYSFRATFTSGNGNFGASTSVCEPLTISAGTTVTATVIKNAAGGATVTGALPLGSSVFDTATVTPTPGGFTPTGSVAYTFFGNGTCDGTGSGAGGGALVGGVPPNSNNEGPLGAGSYSFEAIYSGDANVGGSTSVCEPLTISAGTSTTATVIKNAVGGATVTGALPLGSSVFDTATVAGVPGVTPTGSVAYTFFTSVDCTTGGTAAGGGALVGGVPPDSNPQGPLQAGSYSFEAIYSGDANYAGSTSVCEPLTISAGTTVTATVIKNAVGGATVTAGLPLGSSVFDTATVTPTPTGTGFTPTGSVAYTFFTSVDCTTGGTAAGGGALVAGVPPDSNPQGPLQAGSYSFEAIYSGDANDAGSTSVCEPLTISAGTSTTATVIKNAAGGVTVTGALPLGSSVFDTATVTPTPTGTGFTPTGSVAYTFFTSVDCTTGGTAAGGGALVGGVPPNSNQEGPLGAGSYSFEAIYSGDANYAGSTSVCEPLTISAGTSTTATVIKNAAGGVTVTGALPLGSSVFDTATVTPTPGAFTPTGSVAYTFFSNGTCDGTGSGAGGGALVGGVPPNSNNEGPLAAGSYSFRAIFTSGDSNFGGSTSVCEPLTISAGTSTTATVIKNAVGGATVTAALPLGSSVFDTATVTPTPGAFTPTGSVAYTFFSNGTCDGTGTAAGGGALLAGLPPTSNTQGPLQAGSFSFRAIFTSGDSNFGGSTSDCEPVVIAQVTPTIATTPTPGGPVGTSVSDTATVSGGSNPTGTVTFQLFGPGDATCSAPPVFSSANRPLNGAPPSATSDSFPTGTAGTYQWVATYSGDTNDAAVSSDCGDEPVVIAQLTPTIATMASPGGPVGTSVSDTATVSGGSNPTGTVTFQLFGPGDATCSAPPVFTSANRPLSGAPLGAVSFPFPPTAAGTYQWVATYHGDTNNAAVSSVCGAEPVTIDPASQAGPAPITPVVVPVTG